MPAGGRGERHVGDGRAGRAGLIPLGDVWTTRLMAAAARSANRPVARCGDIGRDELGQRHDRRPMISMPGDSACARGISTAPSVASTPVQRPGAVVAAPITRAAGVGRRASRARPGGRRRRRCATPISTTSVTEGGKPSAAARRRARGAGDDGEARTRAAVGHGDARWGGCASAVRGDPPSTARARPRRDDERRARAPPRRRARRRRGRRT